MPGWLPLYAVTIKQNRSLHPTIKTALNPNVRKTHNQLFVAKEIKMNSHMSKRTEHDQFKVLGGKPQSL